MCCPLLRVMKSRWNRNARIGIVRDHLHYIEKLIERVDICINTMVEKYDGAFSLLRTIPGIDRSSPQSLSSQKSV